MECRWNTSRSREPDLSNPARKPTSRLFSVRRNSAEETRIRMKTTIACVFQLLVLAAVCGASQSIAQQSPQASGETPQRPQGPCDIYAAAGAPCGAAHSTTRALYAAYNGPHYQDLRQ